VVLVSGLVDAVGAGDVVVVVVVAVLVYGRALLEVEG
jgi:hypothetical protein